MLIHYLRVMWWALCRYIAVHNLLATHHSKIAMTIHLRVKKLHEVHWNMVGPIVAMSQIVKSSHLFIVMM